MTSNTMLTDMLDLAVPLEIAALKAMGGPDDAARARVAHFARRQREEPGATEDLLFGRGQPGRPASMFAELAFALAVMAFQPGGSRFGSCRWSADPEGDRVANAAGGAR